MLGAACDSHVPDKLDPPPNRSERSIGLDARPSPVTCTLARPAGIDSILPNPDRTPDAKISFTSVTSYPFVRPIEVQVAKGAGDRIYVAEQTGNIRYLDGTNRAYSALNILTRITTGYDQGILGFALHPKFPDTPYIYVTYTAPTTTPPPPNVSFVSVVSRFETKDGGLSFDPDSEKKLITYDHPGENHNNDTLLFGPDGYLYLGFGDGGDLLDVKFNNAQQKTHLQGKILRIDVDHGDPYAIPPTNPFANATDGSRPEIYAYGLRNPWRFNFDSKPPNRLWAGDVGYFTWEEIDNIVAGGNYGWGNREGFECFTGGVTCDGNYIDPLLVHTHYEAAAIIGGVFYYGTAVPELTGTYVYADAQSSDFWSVNPNVDPAPGARRKVTRLDNGLGRVRPVTLRLDANGEILVVSYLGKLLRVGPPGRSSPRKSITETGCVDNYDPRVLSQGLFHYDVNVSQYSDGLVADRQLAIPPDAKIDVDIDTGRMTLPNGSIAMRTLSENGKNVETQLLYKSINAGLTSTETYVWNDTTTDARLVTSPTDVVLPSGRVHHVDPTQCLRCHSPENGSTLGLELAQLDRDDVVYGPNHKGNPLDTLEHLGMLNVSGGVSGVIDRATYRPLPRIDGTDLVEARARAYLHANCAFCHQAAEDDKPGLINLQFTTPLKATRTCNQPPSDPAHGLYVIPTKADESLLIRSMKSQDESRSPRPMPPVLTSTTDTQGVSLVAQWINSLGGCP